MYLLLGYDDVDPVIRECCECGHQYRTYVPGASTKLPTGSVVFYDEPQLRCPECDPIGYGLFMNFDLFPHLCPEKRVEKTLEVESEEKETL